MMRIITARLIRILLSACLIFFLGVLQPSCTGECTTTKTVCEPCDASSGQCCEVIIVPLPCPGGLGSQGLTDGFAGGLAISNNVSLSNVQVSVDEMPVSLDTNLDDASQIPLIRDRMQAQGAYNPQTQHLHTFQTIAPLAISLDSVIIVSFTLQRISNGSVPIGQIGFGATSQQLLKPGITDNQFFALAEGLPLQNIPTLSSVALIFMFLVLAAAGSMLLRVQH